MNILKKKLTLIAYVFAKLRIVKDVIRQISKKSRFRRPFEKRYGKRSQTLLKSAALHFYHINWSLQRQVSWKKSLLVICNILGLFVNTITTDEKYCLLNKENLMQSIEIKIPEKQNPFSQLFFVCLKFR